MEYFELEIFIQDKPLVESENCRKYVEKKEKKTKSPELHKYRYLSLFSISIAYIQMD